MKSTVYMLITVAAAAILVATLWLPVLQIYGNSMTPTMHNGDIVFSLKSSDFEQGDVVTFYYNNKILVKRVIAGPADWVDITEDGTVYVNGELLEEPYVADKALGDTNIELPYQVPDAKVLLWEIIVPLLWIPGIQLSAVLRKSRWLEKSFSESGPLM